MTYAICFDFPEGGDPWFAGFAFNGTPGLAPNLRNAKTFDSEQDAERFLEAAYGPNVRSCGVVVEVGQ